MRLDGLGKLKKKSNDLTGNRIRDLPACIIVLQPTTLPRAPPFALYDFRTWYLSCECKISISREGRERKGEMHVKKMGRRRRIESKRMRLERSVTRIEKRR
jgi:hypothetical protein